MSPRPPRPDGQGDQRRAHEIVVALSRDWAVDIVSWLPDVSHSGRSRWLAEPMQLARGMALALRMPAEVAYVQGRSPRALARRFGDYDITLFITDRAVPGRVPRGAIIDFIDDSGSKALRRAHSLSGASAWFWRWEGGRLRRFDRRLAATATLCVAHGSADALGIADGVHVVPLSAGTRPLPDTGDRIAFVGNLFYAPNHDAAMWMCSELVPYLLSRGVEPKTIVIAGRRPRASLVEQATSAGIDFRPDVPGLEAVLEEAAVVVAPMVLGTGALYKVIDAVGMSRACVLTPLANAGLGLVDGESALICGREPEPFGEAILRLLADPSERQRLAHHARRHLIGHTPESVTAQWRSIVASLLPSSPVT